MKKLKLWKGKIMDLEKSKNIGKIRLLHDMKEKFNIDDDTFELFKNQISNDKYLNEIEKFFNGYEAEDIFRFIYSSLPWIKLIVPLDQEQFPLYSKEKYQVPDYLVYVENNKLQDFPVLFEVKSVDKDKMKLKLMGKQVDVLMNFSKTLKTPLLFAIFWRKFNAWIITSIEYFTQKSNTYILNLEDSLKNELSVFLSDFYYFFNTNFIVKISYKLEKKGEVQQLIPTNYEVSTDGKNFLELKREESAVLDCFLNLKEISKYEKDNEVIILKKNDHIQVPKISHIIMRYLKMFNLKVDIQYSSFASHVVHNVIKKLSINNLYILPIQRCNTSDDIFKKAFYGSGLYKKYKKAEFRKN